MDMGGVSDPYVKVSMFSSLKPKYKTQMETIFVFVASLHDGQTKHLKTNFIMYACWFTLY